MHAYIQVQLHYIVCMHASMRIKQVEHADNQIYNAHVCVCIIMVMHYLAYVSHIGTFPAIYVSFINLL